MYAPHINDTQPRASGRDGGIGGALLLLIAVALVIWFGVICYQAYVAVFTPPTFTKTASGCRFPEEGEQLVIVVTKQSKQLVLACNYVMAPGAARRKASSIRL